MNPALLDPAPLLEGVPGSSVEDGYGPATVDVPVDGWASAARLAREELGCDFFDFLTAVDGPDRVEVVCHLARTAPPFGHLLLRTQVPAGSAVESLVDVYAGAGWHERETAEMFGITFTDHGGASLELEPLLLPPGFAGHPLRKDFALQARLDRAWPGAKEPGGG